MENIFEGKQLQKWLKVLLAVVCCTIFVGAVVLVVVGIVFCVDEERSDTAGTVMLIVGFAVLVIHLALAFLSRLSFSEDDAAGQETEEEPLQEKNQEPNPVVSYWDGEE